jgi:phosphoserine phosphatase RsbU/P
MSAAIQTASPDLRTELVNWKQRLESSAINSSDGFQLDGLLREVESAIERLTQQETYGVCQVCHDLIGQAAMNADPLARNCLSCFTPEQLRELEQDLDRAWLIQGESLPKQNLKFNGWEVSYHYEPAGPVSGDYCDLVNTETGDLYFLIGDVSGKGIAASLLMSRLHAIFRSLIGAGLAVNELVERANQIFGDTTMRPYYATLVCGKAAANGDLEICNAGHCPPLLVSGGEITPLPATGLPIGMFCQEKYSATRAKLNPGDRLLLYTDGLSEARNSHDHGDARLKSFLRESLNVSTPVLLTNLLDDLRQFSVAPRVTDDLTIMAIESVGH